MKRAMVVGGNSGIGLSIVVELLSSDYDTIYIIGKDNVCMDDVPSESQEIFREKTKCYTVDLTNEDYSILEKIQEIDALYITIGFGRVASFTELTQTEIEKLLKCNQLAVIQIVKMYCHKLFSKNSFICAIMGSIAGHVASPLFSVYGSAKKGLCGFIENVNIELQAQGYENRILDVSPGSLKGTKFAGGKNNLTELQGISREIIRLSNERQTLYIPQFDEVYGNVLERYHKDPVKFGLESYEYKVKNNRLSVKPQTVIGYLSGTFDLFHIGHLNLLRRAKAQCDYLVVGVHKSGAWKGKETYIPFEERISIVESIKYVDKAIESFQEDADAWKEVGYHKLFVGSDYKGSERFQRYEAYFSDKDVEIVYFPYTKSTSSTQLRNAISKDNKSESN